MEAIQPGAQFAFLTASQPLNFTRIVDVALDQRQRVQHRIVQMRSELGALLLTNSRPSFGRQRAHHAEPPRTADHRDTGDQHRRGEQAIANLAPFLVIAEKCCSTSKYERRTDEGHRQARRLTAADCHPPTGALRLIGLLPQNENTESGQRERPQQRTGQPEPEGLDAEHATDRDGHQRHVLPAPSESIGSLRTATSVASNEGPESRVHGDSSAARESQHHEDQPHDEDVDAQMIGEAAAHAGQQTTTYCARELRSFALLGCGSLR